MMPLSQLWLPILLSAVAVFVTSSLVHMVLPWHKGDYPRMQNEDAVMDAMRPLALPPGDYLFPRPSSMAEMQTPEFAAKMARGPNVLMTVMPNGPVAMGGTFVKWFIYLIVVSIVVAISALGVARGAPGVIVFHQVALVSFAAYALALWQLTIWYHRSVSITLTWTLDAAIYAVVTGLIFAWLWPR
jgi:hypothetical protein